MYHESTIMLHGRGENIEGTFVTREEGGYGPAIKLELLEKGNWEGSRIYLFLGEANLARLLEVLDAITTKMRLHLYSMSVPAATLWEEWNNVR